jgi:hypothetical protein
VKGRRYDQISGSMTAFARRDWEKYSETSPCPTFLLMRVQVSCYVKADEKSDVILHF